MPDSAFNLVNGDIISKGKNPQGQIIELPVSGIAGVTGIPLAANATWTSGWVSTTTYKAALYAIQADQPSAVNGVVIEYSTDGLTPTSGGIARTYNTNPNLFQVALSPKPNFMRLTYTNGSTAQTTNYILLLLSDTPYQGTMASVAATITGTNLAQVVKAVLELSDGSTYGPVQRTGTALNVALASPNTGTGTTVASSTTTVTLLAANPLRKGAIIVNEGGVKMSVFLGSGGTLTKYSYPMAAGAVLEIPFGYTGIITGVWASVNGNARVTELT